MDKSQKKHLQKQWREQQRACARDQFPLPPDQMAKMFDALSAALSNHECNHTRGVTKEWLESHGHNVEAVFAWLDDNGGFCDCEVLANSEEAFKDAIHDGP